MSCRRARSTSRYRRRYPLLLRNKNRVRFLPEGEIFRVVTEERLRISRKDYSDNRGYILARERYASTKLLLDTPGAHSSRSVHPLGEPARYLARSAFLRPVLRSCGSEDARIPAVMRNFSLASPRLASPRWICGLREGDPSRVTSFVGQSRESSNCMRARFARTARASKLRARAVNPKCATDEIRENTESETRRRAAGAGRSCARARRRELWDINISAVTGARGAISEIDIAKYEIYSRERVMARS